MISMAHLNQLSQLSQIQVAAPHLQHLQNQSTGNAQNVQGLPNVQQVNGMLQQSGPIAGTIHTNGNSGVHPGMSLPGPPVHIVANPMGQDSLYTTIGDVSERVYECPDECPPPVPPKQMEVLYTKPTKVFPKSNGGAALKIYKSRENVPSSPTKDSSGSGTSSSDTRDIQQENYALKQEILAYRERMKALAMKLEQFDGISAIVEELQGKVDKVSQENTRLRCFEREHREAQEQLKEAQRQYKLDVDQLSSQVAILDGERNDLECSLAKLQEEHDCLMISSQNSVSFQYHSQAMLEVKRLLEELKNKYQNDKEALLLRVEVVEQEKLTLKSNASQLEEEIATIRAERDQLTQSYRKAVRQKQSLVQHIKDLQSEDSELHALMQSLLQSAHQAVAERDTLERLVKPASSGSAGHGDMKSVQEHRKVSAGGTQILQPQPQPLGQTALSASVNSQSGEWINNQSFLSC
ncbi:hypothetical protein BIW11_03528 [Tropilaelaps mercedesae]|uniref:Uncharacterized protein n=1 Tax=Tropilaelaps mercedesae TaxID=418985 RepID=A0A1V9XJK9_9ACAR|nr:hypothetical protein BIW11_03528 [Tropilaelaps mercedesae]